MNVVIRRKIYQKDSCYIAIIYIYYQGALKSKSHIIETYCLIQVDHSVLSAIVALLLLQQVQFLAKKFCLVFKKEIVFLLILKSDQKKAFFLGEKLQNAKFFRNRDILDSKENSVIIRAATEQSIELATTHVVQFTLLFENENNIAIIKYIMQYTLLILFVFLPSLYELKVKKENLLFLFSSLQQCY